MKKVNKKYYMFQDKFIHILKKIPWYRLFPHCDLWFESKYALFLCLNIVMCLLNLYIKIPYVTIVSTIGIIWCILRQGCFILFYVGETPLYKYTISTCKVKEFRKKKALLKKESNNIESSKTTKNHDTY